MQWISESSAAGLRMLCAKSASKWSVGATVVLVVFLEWSKSKTSEINSQINRKGHRRCFQSVLKTQNQKVVPLNMPFLPCDAGQTEGLTLHFQINAFKESKIRRFYRKVASFCLTSTTECCPVVCSSSIVSTFSSPSNRRMICGTTGNYSSLQFQDVVDFYLWHTGKIKVFHNSRVPGKHSQSDWWGHPFQEEKIFNCVNGEKMRKRKVLSAIIISWRPRRISADGR